MNCPSRTDDTILHPGWNQSPPHLAADLTTREDFGDVANARGVTELIDSSPNDRFYSKKHGHYQTDLPNGDEKISSGASRGGRKSISDVLQNRLSAFWQTRNLLFISLLFNVAAIFHMTGQDTPQSTRFSDKFGEWNIAPLRKRGTCASGGGNRVDYNLPLHVGAVFIILFVSGSACAFPMLAMKFPRLRIPPTFLFCARHFGTGVLLATAFVHLLPTGFILLGDPCLSGFWTNDYPAMPGAIALAAVFFVTIIEMVFSPAQHMCSGDQRMEAIVRQPSNANREAEPSEETLSPRLESRHGWTSPVRVKGPLIGRRNSFSRRLTQLGEENETLDQIDIGQPAIETTEPKEKLDLESSKSSVPGLSLTDEQKNRKGILQCVLLEVGILFHSVFIGMALSVSRGNEFVILLIAITFHQTFEGLALGSRIASLSWPKNTGKPWLMALAYGCTTPIGQAIGLATHTLYDPDSEVGLLLVGIMNAISAGLLVYASLVELLSEDFLSDESWRVLRGKRRVWACVLVFFGAFGMSLVGAWA
ncbi:Zip-domain-containing protein [Eremomyces bilateralis CBS 781.70]|uniref:Zip-domain-containing protein n=1 Tax=Eremomyces bilateralis CBS 781.70 TaxID=1392243 RepID=A0A6G1GGQ4_9PEZI|nr:Zip-domain-containing protein [Eremomyces bilateralis CBS 781.70]KAF1817172.1 Zip-domain-containing protein [Eremomyces bilateralis CBS 781.70]